tara:strand:+ start:270 stop:581 length:312 start_codon:yes stop_codon:yes gene_type:complete
MIKINTLTKEEIDNISICEIDLSRRTLTVLMNTHYRDNIDNSEIKTLLDLKNYVVKNYSYLRRIPNVGTKTFNEIVSLIKHSYPDVILEDSIGYYNQKKYTFN